MPTIGPQKRDFLVAGLQGGWLSADQAADTFLQIQQQKQDAQQQKRLMAQQSKQQGLDALRDQTLAMTSDEAYQTPEQFQSRLMGLAQTYGLNRLPQQFAAGASNLFASQQAMLSEEEKASIINFAFMNRTKMGRADVRAHVREGAMRQFGPEGYAQIQGEVNSLIDEAYAGTRIPEL